MDFSLINDLKAREHLFSARARVSSAEGNAVVFGNVSEILFLAGLLKRHAGKNNIPSFILRHISSSPPPLPTCSLIPLVPCLPQQPS